MNQSLRTLLPVSAAIVCFAVPSAQAKPPVRVVSKELHCSLEVPKDWKPHAETSKLIWSYVGLIEQNFTPNVNVAVSPESVSPLPDEKTFSDAIRKQYASMGTVFGIKTTTVGGLPAYSCRLRVSRAGLPAMENHQLFCVFHARMYVVTFTELSALKKKYDPIGDQIIASFQFEK